MGKVCTDRQLPPRLPVALARCIVSLGVGLISAVGCQSDDYTIGAFPAVDPSCNHWLGDPSVVLCSGFEQPAFPEWGATFTYGAASLELASDRVLSGTTALHASSQAQESTAVLQHEFSPLQTGTMHLRVYIYVPSGPITSAMNLLFWGHDPNPVSNAAFVGTDINLENGALQVFSPQNSPDRITSDQAIPRDEWFCMRAEVALGSDGTGQLVLLIDEEPVLTLDSFTTVTTEGIGMLRAGIDWSSAQAEPFEVYMDDLVLSTTPAGCALP